MHNGTIPAAQRVFCSRRTVGCCCDSLAATAVTSVLAALPLSHPHTRTAPVLLVLLLLPYCRINSSSTTVVAWSFSIRSSYTLPGMSRSSPSIISMMTATRRSSTTTTAIIAVAVVAAMQGVDGHIVQVFPISRQYSCGPGFKDW